MALVLVGFTWYSQPSEEQIRAAQEADSIAAVQRAEAQRIAEEQAKAQAESAQAAALDSASILFDAAQGTEQLITLENDLLSLVINTHGGVVETATIKNYNDQQHEPVRLITPDDAQMSLALAAKNENIVTSDLYFEVVSADSQTATLRLPVASGSLDIEYRLHSDAYMVDMVVKANGISGLFAPSMRTLDIVWTDRARQLEKGFDFEQRYACIRYHEADGDTDNEGCR